MTDLRQAAQQSLTKQTETGLQQKKATTTALLKNALSDENVKKRFEEILGKRASGFAASISSLVSSNTNFENCDHKSIIGAAMTAAIMDLPINQNFGFAYIIPYNESFKDERGNWGKRKVAQFQLGYKGYIQLAMRTGQYKTLSSCEYYEGEIKHYNRFTGEIELDTSKDFRGGTVAGYVAYFKLINGFEKYLPMTIAEINTHAKRYSKTFSYESGKWNTDFDAMAKKTVLKLLLSKYGILSIEMQTALSSDQAVVTEKNGEIEYAYIDEPTTEAVIVNESTGEITETDYESPLSIIQKAQSITTIKEWNKWKKENKAHFEAIGGSEGDKLAEDLSKIENELIKAGK